MAASHPGRYCSHTCESFTPEEVIKVEPTGELRATAKAFSPSVPAPAERVVEAEDSGGDRKRDRTKLKKVQEKQEKGSSASERTKASADKQAS